MLHMFTSFENNLFMDEANFHLNGHINKQNCRYSAKVTISKNITDHCIIQRSQSELQYQVKVLTVNRKCYEVI